MLSALSGVPREAFAHSRDEPTAILADAFPREELSLSTTLRKIHAMARIAVLWYSGSDLKVTSYLAVPVVSRRATFTVAFFAHPAKVISQSVRPAS